MATVKRHTTCSYNDLPLPFDPGGEPEFEHTAPDGRTVLAFLVRDDSPTDPFEEYDEGEFYQFDHRYKHHCTRPELDKWKRIIRANPGRVVTVDCCGDGYRVGSLVLPAYCRGEDCKAANLLDDMDGYYIAPDDVTDTYDYARGALATYSAWCEGDVWGCCVWVYNADGKLEDRDGEVWGFYGYEYAREKLKSMFEGVIS